MLLMCKGVRNIGRSRSISSLAFAQLRKSLPIDLSSAVEEAFSTASPILAVSQSIPLHGSHASSSGYREVCKESAVTPASIAILKGRIKIGLSDEEVDFLATRNRGQVSKKDISTMLARGDSGVLNLSATAFLANLVGIKVLSTGWVDTGLPGGDFNPSLDLFSLSDTPVTLVCAGSSSINHIAPTLRHLDAVNVLAASYQSDNWPSLDLSISQFVSSRFNDPLEVARAMLLAERMGSKAGILLAVHACSELDEMDNVCQLRWIMERVEQDCANSGLVGSEDLRKRVNRVFDLTRLASSHSDTAMRHTLRVGCQIALAHSRLSVMEAIPIPSFPIPSLSSSSPQALFVTKASEGDYPKSETTTDIDAGNVGRRGSKSIDIDERSATTTLKTGGLADMTNSPAMRKGEVKAIINTSHATIVAFDDSLPAASIAELLDQRQSLDPTIFYQPSSDFSLLCLPAAIDLLSIAPSQPLLSYSVLTAHQLGSLHSHINDSESSVYEMGQWFDYINVSSRDLERLPSWISRDGIVPMAVKLLPIFGVIFVNCGEQGVVVVQRISGEVKVQALTKLDRKRNVVISSDGVSEAILIKFYQPIELDLSASMVDESGFARGVLACLVRGLNTELAGGLDEMVAVAQRMTHVAPVP